MACDPRSDDDPRLYMVGQNTTRLLMAAGDLVVGWLLLRQADVALAALDAGAAGTRPRLLRGQGRRGDVLRPHRAAPDGRRARRRRGHRQRPDGPAGGRVLTEGRPRSRMTGVGDPASVATSQHETDRAGSAMTTIETTATADTATADAFAERVFAATLGSVETLAVYVGDRLGWYRSLAADGPATAPRAGRPHRHAAALCPRVARAAGRHRLPRPRRRRPAPTSASSPSHPRPRR